MRVNLRIPSPPANLVPIANPITTPIDTTVASSAIEVTGRAFVNPTLDVWGPYVPYGNITITRYNRSRKIRYRNWLPTVVNVQCQASPGADGFIAVVVNGALHCCLLVTQTDAIPRWYQIPDLPAGAKTIDFIEDFQERGNNLDRGIDGWCLGTYVSAIEVPAGAVNVKMTAATGVALFGDSHLDGDADPPCAWNGWGGQVRRRAEAAGWLAGYVGAGSSTLCGDGPDPTQTAQMVTDVWADMGCTTKWFVMMRRPNDYAYYGAPGSIDTPAEVVDGANSYEQFLTDVFAALDAQNPGGWQGICTRIPQGTGWGLNAGGFDRLDYWSGTVNASVAGGRTNVQTFDGSVDVVGLFGLVLATDFVEAPNLQVHMKQVGHDKVAPIVSGWLGI